MTDPAARGGASAGARGRRLAVVVATVMMAAATHAGAQLQYSFERQELAATGWRAGGGEIGIDDGIALDGGRSLRVSGAGRGGARVELRIPPPDVDGNRVRFVVHTRDEGESGASFSLRIDAPENLLYLDRAVDARGAERDGWMRYEIEAPILERATAYELGIGFEGAGWIDAVSIEGVDTTQRPPPTPAAARYLDYALWLIGRHSMYRNAVDWPQFQRAVIEQAHGAEEPADTYLALRYALARLGDWHAYFRAPDRAEVLAEAPVSNARTGRPVVWPEGRRLPGSVAYLTVPGFAGGTHADQVEFAERLQGLIRELDAQGTCGWIVDLRSNSCGSLWPPLTGLGPLLGDGDVLSFEYPDGRRETVWYRDGKGGMEDAARLRVRGEPYRVAEPRVAVLLARRTASAGEVLAMAFRGAPAQRSFGTPTRGATSGTRTFILLDGAELILAVVSMGDRTGRLYTGPLEPDEIVDDGGARGQPLLEQADVQRALSWLSAGC